MTNKTIKKVLALILAMALLLSLTACGKTDNKGSESAKPAQSQSEDKGGEQAGSDDPLEGLINYDSTWPVVNRPVDVSITAYPHGAAVFSEVDPATHNFVQMVNEKSGMNIKWEIMDGNNKGETLPLILSSGEMPDLLLGNCFNTGDIVNYGVSQGLLYPVDELLQYMPTYSRILEEKPEVREVMTAPDGHMYCFPLLGYAAGMYYFRPFINTDWLEAVGMENPTTLDELYEVLKAFKEQDANGNGDPNDEIPVGKGDYGDGIMKIALNAYGVETGSYGGLEAKVAYSYAKDPKNPEIVFTPLTEEYKNALIYANKLWSEGLLDPEMYTEDNVEAAAKLNDNVIGVYNGNSPSAVITTLQKPNEHWWALNALVDEAGDTPVVPQFDLIETLCGGAISAECTPEKAAALARFVDYLFTEDYYTYAWYGPDLNSDIDYLGKGAYFDEESGSVKYAGDVNGVGWWVYAITHYNFWAVPGYTSGNKEYVKHYAETYPDTAFGQVVAYEGLNAAWEIPLVDKIQPYHVSGFPFVFFDDETSERMALLRTQLNEVVERCESKFITGELNLDSDYDAFIEELKTCGAEEYLEAHIKAVTK